MKPNKYWYLTVVFLWSFPVSGEYQWQVGYDDGFSLRHNTRIGWIGISLYADYSGHQFEKGNVWQNKDRNQFVLSPYITYLKNYNIATNLDLGPYVSLGYRWTIVDSKYFNGITNSKIAICLSYKFNRIIFESKLGIEGFINYGDNETLESVSFFGGNLSSIGIMLLF